MNDSALDQDADARRTALDVTRSFIVQAPAGSGKTGLLIQRYLALLARVEHPERILAMTFTRKAAGEMQERILQSLRAAQSEPEPETEHESLTWRLARDALRRDVASGWNLVSHPARLRVQTIDALCAALMRQAPLTAKLGALPELIERAEGLHIAAAREEVAQASADDPAWRCLLDYLDNDGDVAVALLAGMLGKRDQWLRHLVTRDHGAMRAASERALTAETEGELAALRSLFPQHTIKGLLRLAGFAARNLGAAEHAHTLAGCGAARELPPASADVLPRWRALADWLLTLQGELRKQVGAKQGFPPNNGGGGAASKQAMQALLAELSDVPGLAPALDQVRRLPPPRYEDAAWDFIAALLEVLPRTVARLRTVFGREGVIDFAEATLIALDALGSADAPSDLLLSLDLRVEHLLIDEFQDTSLAQYQLIERISAGWTAGEGRTLFAVGDPMQSIYRFREAEVRLFIEAQQARRIGGVEIEPVTLARNFRSRPELVKWVNRVFPQVLSPRNDPLRGAVAFSEAHAACDPGEGTAVTIELREDPRSEADLVVGYVRSALRSEGRSIAILVRKRLDLDELLPALRAGGIAYAAVEIDRMSERQAILDLVSLTRALIQPDDRLSWFSVLRAPWCGLTLADLFAVDRANVSFPELIAGRAELSDLSADGKLRLERFAQILRPLFEHRGRSSLLTSVRGVWLALGGPACGAESIDLAAADRFFDLLAAQSRGADVADWEAFVDSLANLYAEPEGSVNTPVQIMTLHRAKGLEFDVVVMPGLGRGSKQSDEELLLWRERPAGLLLAPMRSRTPGRSKNEVYEYLRSLAGDEEKAELGRLLYVGCTRAKQRLHLTGVGEVDTRALPAMQWRKPQGGTALEALWEAVMADVAPPVARALAGVPPAAPGRGVPLVRLPLNWRLPAPPAALPTGTEIGIAVPGESIAFDWAREIARSIGTITHAILREIAEDGLSEWNEQRVDALESRVRREFAASGFTPAETHVGTVQVLAALRGTLADARGRWLFDPAHAEAASEYALTGVRGEAVSHVVLDRTFVDSEGVRWIVDFKLSRHEGSDREAFLESEKERYREQLENYARVVRGGESRKIRLGLYFPLLNGWREWEAPA
ncbi:MAG TPA: UvrD-helicase domain-containing protein [Casimicrobiaceae bacterium]|nr:UvrD-helicase domain-containing protein [Casimicrobiaceae bacterium]